MTAAGAAAWAAGAAGAAGDVDAAGVHYVGFESLSQFPP